MDAVETGFLGHHRRFDDGTMPVGPVLAYTGDRIGHHVCQRHQAQFMLASPARSDVLVV